MSRYTVRFPSALFVLSPFLLWPKAGAQDVPVERREPIVLGPFKLGEIFDSAKASVNGPLMVGVPDRKDVIKALNECEAYLIEERIFTKDKKVRFGEQPKLVLSGKLQHEFKGKNSTFQIQIASCQAGLGSTDYSVAPATRSALLTFRLKTTGANGLLTSCTSFSVQWLNLSYDLDGKVR